MSHQNHSLPKPQPHLMDMLTGQSSRLSVTESSFEMDRSLASEEFPSQSFLTTFFLGNQVKRTEITLVTESMKLT